MTLEPVGHRRVAFVSSCEVAEGEDGGWNSGSLGALECANAARVRGDGDDRQPGIEQCLKIRALAADEHADHRRAIVPMTRSSPGSGSTAQ